MPSFSFGIRHSQYCAHMPDVDRPSTATDWRSFQHLRACATIKIRRLASLHRCLRPRSQTAAVEFVTNILPEHVGLWCLVVQLYEYNDISATPSCIANTKQFKRLQQHTTSLGSVYTDKCAHVNGSIEMQWLTGSRAAQPTCKRVLSLSI